MDINRISQGDARDLTRQLSPGSIHCCVTSPPYWGLRDYKVDGQWGSAAIALGRAFIGFDIAGGDCDHGGWTPNDRLRAAERGKRLDMQWLKRNGNDQPLLPEPESVESV
jgi:hypothetical protein